MKFTVNMKDPDTLQDAIEDAVREINIEGVTPDELEVIRDKRKEKISELCGRWFEWGEYLRVEIDTEAETCTVVPVHR